MSAEAATTLELEPIERLEDVREDWSRLAEATGHPFATWEWNDCWWRAFGTGRRLYCFACRAKDGEIKGILPLYVATTRPLPIARFLGYADFQSPICAPEDRPAVAEALLRVTRRPHRCRAVVAERMPLEHGWRALLGGTPYRIDSGPIVLMEGRSWEEFVETRSKWTRRKMRRTERRIGEKGLEIRLASDPDRLPDDMEMLFNLHDLRWGAETTGVYAPSRHAFHIDFAGAALRNGWLRLWLAEVDGEPAAAYYGWRFGGVEWAYGTGRDPRFDNLSAGMTLWVRTLHDAFDDGLEGFHFMAGDEDYKLQWAEADSGAESLVVGSGAAVRLTRGAAWLAKRLPRAARGRLMRTTGDDA